MHWQPIAPLLAATLVPLGQSVLLMSASPVAPDPVDAVGIGEVLPLLVAAGRAPAFEDQAGTWSIAIPERDLDRDIVRYRLTLQLPALGRLERPVVLMWGAVASGVDAAFGLSASTVEGVGVVPDLDDVGIPEVSVVAAPIDAVVRAPTCDLHGDCAVRFDLEVPLAGIRQALPNTTGMRLALFASAVRTFDGGSAIAVQSPDFPVTSIDGTLALPGRTYGTFGSAQIDLLATAAPWLVNSPDLGDELDPRRVIQGALIDAPIAALQPDPALAVVVWRPTARPGRVARVVIDFDDACPAGLRMELWRRDIQVEVAADLAGLGALRREILLPDDEPWTFRMEQAASGRALLSREVPASTIAERIVLQGRLDCDGGGGFGAELGDIQVPPDPEAALPPAGHMPGEATPAASASIESDVDRAGATRSAVGIPAVLAVLTLAGIAGTWTLRRHIRRR